MKQFYNRIWFCLLAILGLADLNAQSGATYTEIFMDGKLQVFALNREELLVRFLDGTTESEKNQILSNLDFVESNKWEHYPSPDVTLVKLIPGWRWEQLAARLYSIPQVVFYSRGLLAKDGTKEFILDKVFIQNDVRADLNALKELINELGGEYIGESFMPNLVEVRLNKFSMLDPLGFCEKLQKSGNHAFVEPDMMKILKRHSTNDPFLNYQWALNNTGSSIQFNGNAGEDMEVFNAWTLTTGSSSIKVAILDEGVDLTHPDLAGNMLPGFDGTGLGSAGGPSGNDAHGTACAGQVAAVTNNSTGVAGIAPQCKIVPVRIAYSNSDGDWVTTSSGIGTSITWAWQTAGADVLSNSWGGGSSTSLITNPFNNATIQGRGGLGAPVLVSAGNGNTSTVNYPANLASTISVGASSMCGQRKSPSSCDGETWWGSDYGSLLDIAAPGVKIYTTDIQGSAGYSSGNYVPNFNGTSSACPNAAGVMALMLSANPNMTQTQARNVIEQTSEKVGGYVYSTTSGRPNGTWNNEMGYGRVNANLAVQAALALGGGTFCFAPSNLQGVATTSSSATLSWTTANSGGNGFEIEYGLNGFTQSTGTLISSSGLSTNLTGLLSSTSYSFYVREQCSNGAFSSWVGPVSFTTPCSSYNLPYSESFAIWPPNCWNLTGGTRTVAQASNDYLYANFWGWTDGNNALAQTPPIFVSGNGEVRFRWSHLYSATYPNDRLTLKARVVGSGSWTTLKNLQGPTFTTTGAGNTSPAADANFIQEIISLNTTAFSGQFVEFQLEFYSGYGPNVYVDDFEVRALSTCPTAPSNLSVSAITANSAILSWSAGNTQANQWIVEYGPIGFVQGTGSVLLSSQTSINLTGLNAGTSYAFNVREICSTGDTSLPSSQFNFATVCQTYALPYENSFDVFPPICWDLSGGTKTVTHSSGDYLRANFWGWTIGHNALATSPMVSIVGGAYVKFRWSHLFDVSYPNDRLTLSARLSGSGSWTILKDLSGSTFNTIGAGSTSPSPDANFITDSVYLDPSIWTGDVEFQFDFVSGYGPDVFVDDFEVKSIGTSSTCASSPLQAQQFNNGYTWAYIGWQAAEPTSTQWLIEYGSFGITPGQGTMVLFNQNPDTLSGLTQASTYTFYVYELCANGDTSAPSSAGYAYTLCPQASTPYSYNFDNPNACWQYLGSLPTYLYNNEYVMYPFASVGNGDTGRMKSEAIDIAENAEVSIKFSRFHDALAIDDYLLIRARVIGQTWDTLTTVSGVNYASSGATSTMPSPKNDFVEISATLGSQYLGEQAEFEVIVYRGASGAAADVFLDDFEIRHTACTDAYNVQMAYPGYYRVQLNWQSLGLTSYSVQYRKVGTVNWNAVSAFSNNALLRNLETGVYELKLFTTPGLANPSCNYQFEIECAEDVVYAYNVLQAPEMGQFATVNIFGTNGGQPLYNFSLQNTSTSTLSTIMDKRNARFQGVTSGNYILRVEDKFGCEADSVASFSVDPLDTMYVPNLISAVNSTPNGFRPIWNAIKATGLINYQVRVRNETDNALVQLFTGVSDTFLHVNNLTPGKMYRFNVRSRYNPGTGAKNSAYSNGRNRNLGVGGNKLDESGLGEHLTENKVYPNPTADYLNIEAEIGSIVKLYDVRGRLLKEFEMLNGSAIINLEVYSKGSYMLEIERHSEVGRFKIIRQ